jgi:hypothetical protein
VGCMFTCGAIPASGPAVPFAILKCLACIATFSRALRGFPWHAAADSWRADDWVECRNGHTSISLRPFAWPR